MYPHLDDLKKTLSALEGDLFHSFYNGADALEQRASRHCSAQLLVQDRHCRRIYRTLCEFCNPQDVVMDVRKATAALWCAWRGIHPACGDAVADILSRLVDVRSQEDADEEQSAVALLFSLLESDMNGVTERLAVTERSLQQLRNDVERERTEVLDAATQRKALRRRQMQRIAAVQLELESCGQTLEEEFIHIAGLREEARRLQEEMDKQRAQELVFPTLSEDKHETGDGFHRFHLTELQQFALDVRTHEKAQAEILSKACRVRGSTVHPREGGGAFGDVRTLGTHAERGTGLGEGSAFCSTSDVAASILQRAEGLLHRSYVGCVCRGRNGLNRTDYKHEIEHNHNISPAPSAFSSRPQHTSGRNALFPAPSRCSFTTRGKMVQTHNGGCENDALQTEYGGGGGGSQPLGRQQRESAQFARHAHSEATPEGNESSSENSHRSGCTIEDESVAPLLADDHHAQKENAGGDTAMGEKVIGGGILRSTSSEDFACATVVLSRECASHRISGLLPLAVNDHQEPLHDGPSDDTKSRKFQGESYHGEKKLLLARSRALFLAQLSRLVHKANTAHRSTNRPDTTVESGT